MGFIIFLSISALVVAYFLFVHKRGWFYRLLGIKVYCSDCRYLWGDGRCVAKKNYIRSEQVSLPTWDKRPKYEHFYGFGPETLNRNNDCTLYRGEEEPL